MQQTPGRHRPASRSCGLIMIAAVWSAAAWAQTAHSLRFWNLSANTIVALYLAPAGTSHWSANLCLTDPDKSVDADERLSLPGIAAGTYDVRVVDSAKRSCTFANVAVKPTGAYAFSVSEQQMKACH